MSKGEMLSKMIKIAVDAHYGQFDKGGKPYILHCLTVMHKLRTDDEELQCIAIGHDLIEDTDVDADTLRAEGISERVIAGIEDLTKRKGQTVEEYLTRIKRNPDVVKVKKSDLKHNSDIRRLKGVSSKDITRMIKYHEMYLELEQCS